MPRLQIKGLETIEPSSGRPLYHELDEGRKLHKVRQWWDKKQAQYINVLRVHIVRSCADVDLLVPTGASELRLDFTYEDNALFDFHEWRGVQRVAVADHHTLEILAEYIFPNRLGQAPTLKQYAGLVSCMDGGGGVEDECAIVNEVDDIEPGWEQATVDPDQDLTVVNTFEPAEIDYVICEPWDENAQFECADYDDVDVPEAGWDPALVSPDLDLETLNTFLPAEVDYDACIPWRAVIQCFYKLYEEEGPDLDLGDLSTTHGHWALDVCSDSIDFNSGELSKDAMEE